jgi:hypothetical protein
MGRPGNARIKRKVTEVASEALVMLFSLPIKVFFLGLFLLRMIPSSENEDEPGTVAYACNPSGSGGRGRRVMSQGQTRKSAGSYLKN